MKIEKYIEQIKLKDERIKRLKRVNKELEKQILLNKENFPYCWLCGSGKELTKHSVKGKHRPPFVQLCDSCHKNIEIYKMAIKIMKHEKKLSVTRFKQMIKLFT